MSTNADIDGPEIDPTDAMMASLTGATLDTPTRSMPAAPAAGAAQPAQPAASEPASDKTNGLRALLEGKAAAASAQAQAQPESEKSKRDFTGLDEKEKKIFNNMSRDAYDDLYPKYLEYKQLAPNKDKLAKLPELEKSLAEAQASRWHDHPEAYRLTEEYAAAERELGALNSIVNHFATQFDSLESGAKEVELLQLNDKNQLVPVKVPVDTSTRRVLLQELTAAQTAVGQTQQTLTGLKTSHANRYTQHKTKAEELRKTLTGEYQDLLKEHSAKELAKFPGYYRNDPLAPLVADVLALVNLAGAAMQKQVASFPAAQANAKAAKQAPPTRDGLQTATPTPKGGYSQEEFLRMQEQFGI